MGDVIFAEIPNQDSIEFKSEGGELLSAKGCQVFLKSVRKQVEVSGNDPRNWVLPQNNSHEALLIREFILRAQGQWQKLDVDGEICHCRAVSASTIDQAVVMGAHTIEKIRRFTSANTACGSCLNDCEKILARRINF